MTLHERAYEVGVRELHDRLNEHLDRVERGAEIMVTRRGRPIARLTGVTGEDPLEELARRGLITPPARSCREKRARQATQLGIRSGCRAATLTLDLDTSVLVKLVAIEGGSELAADLWATRHQFVSSILDYPEGRAARGRTPRRPTGRQRLRQGARGLRSDAG